MLLEFRTKKTKIEN